MLIDGDHAGQIEDHLCRAASRDGVEQPVHDQLALLGAELADDRHGQRVCADIEDRCGQLEDLASLLLEQLERLAEDADALVVAGGCLLGLDARGLVGVLDQHAQLGGHGIAQHVGVDVVPAWLTVDDDLQQRTHALAGHRRREDRPGRLGVLAPCQPRRPIAEGQQRRRVLGQDLAARLDHRADRRCVTRDRNRALRRRGQLGDRLRLIEQTEATIRQRHARQAQHHGGRLAARVEHPLLVDSLTSLGPLDQRVGAREHLVGRAGLDVALGELVGRWRAPHLLRRLVGPDEAPDLDVDDPHRNGGQCEAGHDIVEVRKLDAHALHAQAP